MIRAGLRQLRAKSGIETNAQGPIAALLRIPIKTNNVVEPATLHAALSAL